MLSRVQSSTAPTLPSPQAATNQSVYLVYKERAPYSMMPCAAFADGLVPGGPTCAAIANDTEVGG